MDVIRIGIKTVSWNWNQYTGIYPWSALATDLQVTRLTVDYLQSLIILLLLLETHSEQF